jgi:putative drug exporter of the RND superfamily
MVATVGSPKPEGRGVLRLIARVTVTGPRRVIAVVALAMVAIAVFGIPVAKSLSASGLADPNSESASATKVLTDKFGRVMSTC